MEEEAVVVPRAFPQRGLEDVAEGKLLGVHVEMVNGKPKYVLTYAEAR